MIPAGAGRRRFTPGRGGGEDEIGFWDLSVMRRLSAGDRREVVRYAMFREHQAR